MFIKKLWEIYKYFLYTLALEEHFSCASLRCSKDEISDPTRKGSAFGHDTCLENLPVYRLSGGSFHVLKIFF